MYLKKEDVKVRSFKALLDNGKKFITQAREALLKMKLSKAHIILARPDSEDYDRSEEEGQDQYLLRGLLGMGAGMGMGGYSH